MIEVTLPRLGLGLLPRQARLPYAALLFVLAAWLDYTMLFALDPGVQHAPWVSIAIFVVIIVLNEYFGPKPELEDAKPGGLGDFGFPTATEGRPVPLLWGTARMNGPNVVWYGDVDAIPIRKRVKLGLWTSTNIDVGFHYRVGIQMALCRGPGVELIRIWIGDELAYDDGVVTGESSFDIIELGLFGGEETGTGGIHGTVDFYPGSFTQSVNAYLNQADYQLISGTTTTAPSYDGTCHLVVRMLNGNRGAYVGTSTQIKPWNFEIRRFPDVFPGQSASDAQIGDDANPVNVIYEILTNSEWGLGFLAGDIDTGTGSTFLLAANEMITESNSFGMLLEREMEAVKLLALVEEQIDGLVYMSPSTGKWSIALARATVPWTPAVPRDVNESNARFTEFTRGSWEDTTNEIKVKYFSREDEYKETHVVAQDMANMQIQGAGSVLTGKIRSGTITYPGVKNSALASSLCWRALRSQSYPLARVVFHLDRTFWDVVPGEVVNWSNDTLGLVDLPMRISSVNFGHPGEGIIECAAIQDIFKFAAPSYGVPNGGHWQEPTLTLVAYPADQQFAYEAPRGIVVRDPIYAGDDTVRKICCGARHQGGDAMFDIRQRNAAGAPSGDFATAGTVAGFVLIGELVGALSDGTAIPTATITIDATPDTQSELEAAFDEVATLAEMGQSLAYLCQVGNEYMLVSSASVNGGDVDLENVYRGVLDSVQGNHAAGTKVYLLFHGYGLSDTTITAGNQVDVKLIPKSGSSELLEASATTINFTLDKRVLRPYPPPAVRYNGSGSDFGTPSLEGAGSGLNGYGIDVDWRRRNYDATDEIAALLTDQTVLASTEYEVELRIDPTGVNTLVETKAWTTGTGTENFSRLDIIEHATGNAVGEELEVRITARHDIGAETNLESRYVFTHRMTPTSSLTGQFAIGAKTWSNETNDYVAAATGTFTVTLGTGYATTQVSYRLNGGAWNSVIAAGAGVSGTFAASTSDVIELRHDAAEGGANFVEIKNPSSAAVAYGIFLS